MKLKRIGRRKENSHDQLFKGEVHSKIWCTGGKGASEPRQKQTEKNVPQCFRLDLIYK